MDSDSIKSRGARAETATGSEPASLNQLTELLTPIVKQMGVVSNEVREVSQGISDIKKEMKEEFAVLRREFDCKLEGISADLKAQSDNMEEAQARIVELEDWQSEAKRELLNMSTQAQRMQEKMTDLEGRSRRNNIRIFGIPEGTEENSANKFLERFLSTELELPEDTPLQIQRAHRALAQKPPPKATPRSMVVNFLQFETKELVLSQAWRKKIHLGEKRIFFDHDYATAVVQKRREYIAIKKILTAKRIRFQTPLTRMRIHWDSGVKTYDSAGDVMRDMARRGFEVAVSVEGNVSTGKETNQDQAEWQQVRGNKPERIAAVAARERLREFRRGK